MCVASDEYYAQAQATGRSAYIENIYTAGKTGTSEYVETVDGEQVKKNDGWFIGFFDYEGTRYTVSVIVRDIKQDEQGRAMYGGGSSAGVIFKDVVEALTDP